MTEPKEQPVDVEKGDLCVNDKQQTSSKQRSLAIFVGCLVGLAALVTGVAVELKNNNNKSSTTSESTTTSTSTTANLFSASPDRPFNATVPLFTEDVVQGYRSPDEMEGDLTQMVQLLLNQALINNEENYNRYHRGQDEDAAEEDGAAAGAPQEFAPAAPMADEGSTASDGGNSRVQDEDSDFGSNNQEEGVEEGDLIVADETHVFAAFGDKLVVWDPNTGEELAKITMPPIDAPGPRPGQPVPFDDVAMEGQDKADTTAEEDEEPPTEEAPSTRSSFYYPGYYNPKPYIQHLLLHEDRLMVVVGGYGAEYRPVDYTDTDSMPILSSNRGTRIRLYKITGRGLVEMVSEQDIHGNFQAVRAVNGQAHVVTSSHMDIYTHLLNPISVYNVQAEADEGYLETATRIATDKIPAFVSKLVTELSDVTGSMPNLFRVSLMQTDATKDVESILSENDYLNSVVLVNSFDMTSDDTEIQFVSSGAMLPSSWVQVYSSLDTIILASTIYENDPMARLSTQSTHLMGIALDGASSSPKSIGTVEGSILNPRSVDVVGNVLRVATTVREQTFWVFDDFAEDIVESEEPARDDEQVEEEEVDRTQNFIVTLDLDAPDGTMNELDRLDLGKPNEVFTAVRFFDNIAYAVTFLQRDPLYVLDLSDPSNLVILSELDITGYSGYLHPLNEDNTMILGLGEEADEEGEILGLMISVFDITDSANPKVAHRHIVEQDKDTYSYSEGLWDFMAIRYAFGRLYIPLDINNWEDPSQTFHGFAVFVADENGIEEECRINHASWSGDAPGVFPVEEEFEMEAEDSDGEEMEESSSSEPLPDVDGDTMEEEPFFPRPGGSDVCFYCGGPSLARRSFIFNGNLMTTNGPTIRATDLETCTEVWALDISNDETKECCGWWW